eukprot:TRINITY_DN63996_c0_g1_i1.p2 TRINITY_DN63996_c0_g1~~TRINITY_DN63996_c0_g1_i1.p2  ORF type:complete len:111 (-),score=16.94 TRINITY_DN63996_c0_g1_i1:201-533(-)
MPDMSYGFAPLASSAHHVRRGRSVATCHVAFAWKRLAHEGRLLNFVVTMLRTLVVSEHGTSPPHKACQVEEFARCIANKGEVDWDLVKQRETYRWIMGKNIGMIEMRDDD